MQSFSYSNENLFTTPPSSLDPKMFKNRVRKLAPNLRAIQDSAFICSSLKRLTFENSYLRKMSKLSTPLFSNSHLKLKRWVSKKRKLKTSSHFYAVVGISFSKIIPELLANHVFMASFFSWLVAQVAKLFTNCYRKGRWELKVMFDSGGMPSSHTSLVFSLTTAIALQYGLGSPLFPLSLAFSLIVAYDAAGVRRHAGKQAEVLNRILADVFHGSPISDTKLKEVLGHSPLQVTCGAILGVLVGSIYMLRFA